MMHTMKCRKEKMEKILILHRKKLSSKHQKTVYNMNKLMNWVSFHGYHELEFKLNNIGTGEKLQRIIIWNQNFNVRFTHFQETSSLMAASNQKPEEV